jgi:D-beta-D-heptose 7-phosphate kinase/D-beta-D-heptose 1-phosphate adenosyltransferase
MTESETIQQQKSFKILLIGDDCLDVYQYGTVERISPEAPVPIFKYSYKEERGGMARNVKANLEELGCHVDYLSGKTSVKTRLIDVRSRQHLLRIDDDSKSSPLEFATEIPDIYDAIVISDYDKGTVSYDLVEDLIKTVDVPIFIDTKKKDLARFDGCYVKINELEHSQSKTLPSSEWLIVTYGERGAKYDGTTVNLKPVPLVDVTGAGDTFLSALTYMYLQTKDMLQSIEFANKAASITVQHVGVYAPSLEEIK